jgi:hypothetical protein
MIYQIKALLNIFNLIYYLQESINSLKSYSNSKMPTVSICDPLYSLQIKSTLVDLKRSQRSRVQMMSANPGEPYKQSKRSGTAKFPQRKAYLTTPLSCLLILPFIHPLIFLFLYSSYFSFTFFYFFLIFPFLFSFLFLSLFSFLFFFSFFFF